MGDNWIYSPKDMPALQTAPAQRLSLPEIIVSIYMIIMLAVFPLYFDSTKYYSITEAKYNFFVVCTSIFVFVLLLGMIGVYCKLVSQKSSYNYGKEILKSATLPQILMVVYIAVAILSSLLSQYDGTWVGLGRYEGLLSILLYAAIFIAVSMYGEFKEIYIYLMGAMMVIFTIVFVMQIFGGNPFGLYPDVQFNYYNTQFATTVGNVDMIGAVLSIVIPLLAVAFVVLDDKKSYLLLIPLAMAVFIQAKINVSSSLVGIFVTVLVMVPLLMVNNQRIKKCSYVGIVSGLAGALGFALVTSMDESGVVSSQLTFGTIAKLAFCIAVLFAVVLAVYTFFGSKINIKPKTYRIFWVVLILVCIIGSLLFVYTYSGTELGLVSEASHILHGNFDDSLGSYRIFIWRHCLQVFPDAPILGAGPDTLKARMDAASAEYLAEYGSALSFDFAHNDFLQRLCDVGIVGLGVYLAFLIALAVRAFKTLPNNPYILILGAAVLSYLGHSFFSFSLAMVSPLFWVAAGMLDKCVSQTKIKKSKEKK